MRSILSALAVAGLLAACGGEESPPAATTTKQTAPAVTAGDPETRFDPEAEFVADVDLAAFRAANGLPKDADVSQERRYRAPVSSALVYLGLDASAVEQAIDHTRVQRAVFDGELVLVATTQPYTEIAKAMTAAGATDDGGVLAHDAYSLGEAGPGLFAVAFEPDAIRALQARGTGGISRRLQRALDAAGKHPIRAATVDPRGACVKSIAIGGGKGDQAEAIVEIDGTPSPARSRLGRPVGLGGHYAFHDPKVDGTRLVVPFTQYDADLTSFVGGRVYRC